MLRQAVPASSLELASERPVSKGFASFVVPEALLNQLTSEVAQRTAGYVQRFDSLLARISALHDPDCIGALLPLLDDDAEHDEAMFSIIHTIEAFDDDIYIREIIKHLPALFAKSPRWAAIIHYRILNSSTTLAVYSDRIRALPEAERAAVRSMLNAVRKNAVFEPVCEALLGST